MRELKKADSGNLGQLLGVKLDHSVGVETELDFCPIR